MPRRTKDKFDEVKNCLSCTHEPEWEEYKDIFNSCDHCNKHTVGFCKKIYDFMKVIPGHKWPFSFRYEQLEWRKEEKPKYQVRTFDKKHFRYVDDCPAYEPREESCRK